MEHLAQRLADTCLAFTPVLGQRNRADGWPADTQANFIRALEAVGSVGQAAKAVRSALREDAASLKATKDTV
jgi:hypothetical protein